MARTKVSQITSKPRRHARSISPAGASPEPEQSASPTAASAVASVAGAGAAPGQDVENDGQSSPAAAETGLPGKGPAAEIAEKVKELVRLAQEQGYLTYSDINEALPEALVTPEELDEIYIKLRNLEVEIVDQAEVDRVKQPEPEEEDEKTRLDILDDPVRMYLKQMGQVPLLTREQEVEISKRIESAENEVKRIIYGFGFAGKEHIALAEKLAAEPPKERFDRVVIDKKIDSRDNHLRRLRRLLKTVRELDQQVDQQIRRTGSSNLHPPTGSGKLRPRFKKTRPQAPGGISPSSTTNRKSSKRWPWWRRTSTTRSNRACGCSRTSEPRPSLPQHQALLEAEQRKIQRAGRVRPHAPRPSTSRPTSSSRPSPPRPSRPRPKWSRPTCAWSSPSPRNTPTAASPSSTSSRKATWA